MPYSSNFLSSMVKITELFGTSISISLVADKTDVWYMYEDSPGDFFWSDRSLSQRSRLGGLKEVETESFSWFRFDILILGFLTLAWTANGGLLANVPYGQG